MNIKNQTVNITPICGMIGVGEDLGDVRTLQSANNRQLLNYRTSEEARNKMAHNLPAVHCTVLWKLSSPVKEVGGEGGGASHRLAYVEVRGKRSAGNWPFKDVQQAGV